MLLFAKVRAQDFGHNYVGNRLISYRSKRLDLQEDNDKDCCKDDFILVDFGGDNTYQSMNVKNVVQTIALVLLTITI